MTFREWFYQNLPKKVAERAVECAEKQRPGQSETDIFFTVDNPLAHAFRWEDTLEGKKYWSKYNDQINDKRK